LFLRPKRGQKENELQQAAGLDPGCLNVGLRLVYWVDYGENNSKGEKKGGRLG